MVEQIDVASGVLALSIFAFKSSDSLFQIVQSFQSSKKGAFELREELEALKEAIASLQDLALENEARLNVLRLPLLRCGNACIGFERVITECTRYYHEPKTNFRDWGNLQYMGSDISGFKSMLASYKATFIIAVSDVNLLRIAATENTTQMFKEMLENTNSQLQDRLQSLHDELELLSVGRSETKTNDRAEEGYLREEIKSIKDCLTMCAKVSEHTHQARIDESDVISTAKELDLHRHDPLRSMLRLHYQGMEHVSLPQIIICGDESSGKSSVLEAISGLTFPVRDNPCTRFATEIVLHESPNVSVDVSIVAHHTCTGSERAYLDNFRETIGSFDVLPESIKKAETAMTISNPHRPFSEHSLRIKVAGPHQPNLTIIDLPGLLHSVTKQNSETHAGIVRSILESYMAEPRSIMLAVLSAANDFANQIVLELARTVDKHGYRTLGVITKPDTLIPGSVKEAAYISLAQNIHAKLHLGWHVLRNSDTKTGHLSLSTRDIEEQEFFSKSAWSGLPSCLLGSAQLRIRLSRLLVQLSVREASLVESQKLDIQDMQTNSRETKVNGFITPQNSGQGRWKGALGALTSSAAVMQDQSSLRLPISIENPEPTFPLPHPPKCLRCGFPGDRKRVFDNNPIGNAGRPYYSCLNGKHGNQEFITFDDEIGITSGNPQCGCGYKSRLSRRRKGNSQFFSCPVGSCRFFKNEIREQSQVILEETGTSRVGMGESDSKFGIDPTQPPFALEAKANFFVLQLAQCFYEDNIINVLLSVAMQLQSSKEGDIQFNFRTILAQFGQKLENEAESSEQSAVARLVTCLSFPISQDLFKRFATHSARAHSESHRGSTERNANLDGSNHSVAGGHVTFNRNTLDSDLNEKAKQDLRFLNLHHDSPTEMSRMEHFVSCSDAFVAIKARLHEFTMSPLRDILVALVNRYKTPSAGYDGAPSSGGMYSLIAELLEADPGCIGWTDGDHNSWNNALKLRFEEITGEKWDWWPFMPPQQILRPGEARLHWNCDCGEQRRAVLTSGLAREVVEIIRIVHANSQLVACSTSVQSPMATKVDPSPSTSNSNNCIAESSVGTTPSSSGSSPHACTELSRKSSTRTASPPLASQIIFLLVAVGSSFRLSQIRVESYTTYVFFHELKRRYNALRGPWRKWLSIWVYSHCDFYRCDKYDAHRYEPRAEEFPDIKIYQHYQYNPNPMDFIPPIGPHQFYDRFHRCYKPRAALHFYHRCIDSNKSTRDLLQLFPKCDLDLVEDSDKYEPFWGIVAREKPCFIRLLFYNCVCASPCLVFFFMWLFSWGHHGDLQNAAVPLSLMLVGLSILWSIPYANREVKQTTTYNQYRRQR